jgi:hypothetical protein
MITTQPPIHGGKRFDITYADISNSGGCFFFGRGYSMLQHHSANHEIFAKEGWQRHVANCHDRFSERGFYQHITTPALIH